MKVDLAAATQVFDFQQERVRFYAIFVANGKEYHVEVTGTEVFQELLADLARNESEETLMEAPTDAPPEAEEQSAVKESWKPVPTVLHHLADPGEADEDGVAQL